MSRSLPALFVLLFVCSTGFAQDITLLREAQIFDRPDSASAVKATMPAGIELQVLSEQGDWSAISTSTGLVGWIHANANEPEDTDDLIRSIADLSEEAAPPPASASPPPARTSSSAPAAGAGVGAAASSAPPPPPARPPGKDGGSTSFGAPSATSEPGLTSFIAGIYDKTQWISAALDLRSEFKKLDLQYNALLGKITQIGGWFNGTDGFFFPQVDASDFDIDDFFEAQYGATAKFARGDTCPCGADITALEGGMRLNFFPMAASESDAGIYLGLLAGYGTLIGDDAPEAIAGVATGGVEGGIFYRIGESNSPQFIPRVQAQFVRKEFICKSDFTCAIDPETFEEKDTFGDNQATVQLGLEMNYHGLVPGVHLTLIESPAEDQTFESIFGFSFTYAY